MPDLITSLLPQLTSYTIAGLNASPGAVYPAYDGYSLANFPATVCNWLNLPPVAGVVMSPVYTAPFKNHYRRIVVLIVDGLGLSLFQHFLDQEPWKGWLPNAMLAPLTSVTPSTTTSALTTLWTGTTPVEHGILGYEMWLKEYGMIANMIQQTPTAFYGDVGGLGRAGFNPQAFLPVTTLGHHLSSGGVSCFAFQPISIARSGLSAMLLGGAEVVPYRNLSDLWVTLESLLDRQKDKPTCAVAYWGELDDLSHRYGPQDKRVRLEFETFSRTLQRFIEDRPGRADSDTLLVMLADHGQIDTPLNPHYELRRHPDLLADLVMVPSGENRLAYFFLRAGHEDHARAYLERAWPDEFRISPAGDVLQAGLFGSGAVYARVPDRLGDWVVFPAGHAYFWWSDRENQMLGRHGGLSPQEMLVPFWAMEI